MNRIILILMTILLCSCSGAIEDSLGDIMNKANQSRTCFVVSGDNSLNGKYCIGTITRER